jgi:hypothetical protein
MKKSPKPEKEAAPDLDLPAISGDVPFRLSEFRGVKPVVLVFGSFTCDVFHERLPELETVYRQYKDRVAFAFINIREAGHQLSGFEFLLGKANRDASPEGQANRRRMVQKAMTLAGCSLPGYLDSPTEEAAMLYKALPSKLVVVDRDGYIARDLGLPMSESGAWKDLAAVLKEQCSLQPTPAAATPARSESPLRPM